MKRQLHPTMRHILCMSLEHRIDQFEFVEKEKHDEWLAKQEDSIAGDERVEEARGRVIAYLHAYNLAAKHKYDEDADTLIQQLMYVPTAEDVMEEEKDSDVAMRTAESVDDLGPPTTEPVTDELKEEKRKMLAKLINKSLSKSDKKKIMNKLDEYLDVMSLRGENMRVTDSVQHEIITEGAPFRQRLRTYSQPLQRVIDAEVDKMIKAGVIVPSTSPYASNLLLVQKQDPTSEGGVKNRVCVNFIQLNKQTRKDSYPLPNAQDIFDLIGKSKYYSTFDLMSGYWQVMIKPEHRHKTAFITRRGLYEFIVMAFGLCNAPGTFQRLMDAIILPEYRSFIQTYIDDMVVHSRTIDEHVRHLDVLFTTLRQHKLTVKLGKCHFAMEEVKYLGHLISQGQIKPNPEKVEAIAKMALPTNVSELRSFVHCVSYYRRFIPGFADIAAPLFNLVKKGVVFNMDAACRKAYETLRTCLTTAPVLSTPDPAKDYVLETDASGYAMGACLLQQQSDGHYHPVAYASKMLNSAQTRYNATERECLALVWALEHFKTYCEGHRYTCLTDHHALKYLVHHKESTNARVTRWILRLQPYNLKVLYKAGKDNVTADLLSRLTHHLTVRANAYHVRKRKQARQTRQQRRYVEYDVEAIVGKRERAGQQGEYEYEVKWLNYDETSWEPLDMLKNAMNKVVEFEDQQLRQRRIEESNAVITAKDEEECDRRDWHCDQCGAQLYTRAQHYVHKYREHGVHIPKLDSELGVVKDTPVEVMVSLQRNDDTLAFIYQTGFGQHITNQLDHKQRHALRTHDFVLDASGVLYCLDVHEVHTRARVRTKVRLVVPATLRRALIKEVHEGSMAAHRGIVHTCDMLAEYAWWPDMRRQVYQYITSCSKCQSDKRHEKERSLPRPMPVPAGPWLWIGVDVIGPLPTTMRGNVYILTIIDHFTRYAEAIPMPEQNTRVIAQLIVKHIICRYGVPVVMQSDNGSVFVSELAQYIYAALGIKRKHTTPHHPQSNGTIERVNGTFKLMLKIWCSEEQDNWDEFIHIVVFAYNVSFHSQLQEMPFYLVQGRVPRLPIDTVVGRTPELYSNVHAYGDELVQKLRRVHERVITILTEINEQRVDAIAIAEERVFTPGESVWVYDPSTQIGKSRKLTVRWKGPCKVLERVSDVTYAIVYHGKQQIVNKDRLRRHIVEENSDHESYLEKERIMVQTELDRIGEVMQDLARRQREQQAQLEIIDARKTVGNVDPEAATSLRGKDEAEVDRAVDNDIQMKAAIVRLDL